VWSRKSPKYRVGDCAAKWATFTPGDGLTLRSLARWADEDDPPDDPPEDDGCGPDCPNRARVARLQTIVHDQARSLEQTKDHNRFMTQAHGADIASAGKRLTFIDLKKEIDRVPIEEREDGQWVRIRQSYIATCTNQDPATVSKHLKEFKAVGWIDTAVKRTKDSETGAWTSETFVRPLVDLNNTAVISLPAKPRGRRTCGKCGSDKLVREVKIICAECQHEEVSQELVNPPEPELQTANQADQPLEDAAAFFEQQPEPAAEPLNCNAPCIGLTTVLPSELQTAIHSPMPSLIDLTDPSTLPGVRSGLLAPDDPWIRHQQALAAKAVTS
jgi:hypothetical protein